MIGKQVKGTSFRGVLNYLHHKDGAEQIGGNMVGNDPRSLAAEFRVSRELNPRLNKAVYHASLSLPKQEYLDDLTWMAISLRERCTNAQDYLTGMGFEHCQYVVYRHTDQDHDHVHLVASRIRLTDGKTVSDSWDYRRSEQVIRQLEQAYQLAAVRPSWEQEKRAPTTGERRLVERTGEPSLWEQLQSILDRVTQGHGTLPQVIDRLQRLGVSVRVRLTRTGKGYGISYRLQGVAFSGTQLGKAYTFPGLQKYRGVSYEPERDDNAIRALMERDIPPSQPVMLSPGQRRERQGDGHKQNHYQQLWERYSRDGKRGNPVKLDEWTGRKAFEDGLSQKEIARMLIAGSPQVARLHREQGKDKARAYANGVARRVFQVAQGQRVNRKRQMEL